MLKTKIFAFCFLFILVFNQANAQEIILKSKYDDALIFLQENQLIDDKKNFNPTLAINRAEFLKLILRNAGYDPEYEDRKVFRTVYKDVPLNAWFSSYVFEAYQRGIIPKAEYFYPERNLTRFEVLKIFLTFEGVAMPLYHAPKNLYRDVPKDSKLSAIIAAALRLDLMLPLEKDYFGVTRKVTKGEVAQMLYNYSSATDFLNDFDIQTNELEELPYAEILLDVWRKIHQDYLFNDKVNDEKMIYAAISGMVNSLNDPFTVFMPPEEGNSFSDSMEGEIEGIGAYISVKDGKIIIVSPLQGSPAQKAGLKPNDQIIKVNDELIVDQPLFEVIAKIKGRQGTTVKITVLRAEEEKTFVIVREKVKIKSIDYEMKGEIAVIYLNQFLSNTGNDFNLLLGKILSQKPKGIVLDLRNNPGGYLTVAVDVLGYFLPKDEVAVIVDYPNANYKEKTSGNAELYGIPLKVLVNEGSASAAEIVAGALQDYKVAQIIGTKSFGKGTVQELIFYNNDSNLKLTVAKWLTPKGRWINEKGVEPDLFIVDEEKTLLDEQMEKALRSF